MSQPSDVATGTIRFGVFEAHLQVGELRKNGTKIKLEGQPFQVLALLLGRPGQLVTREELKQALWPADTFVDFEHSINVAVKRLREALGDSADAPHFIETLPRRGYRFIYPVNGATKLEEPSHAGHTAGGRSRWVARALLSALATVLLALVMNIGGLRDLLFGKNAKAQVTSLAVLPLENLTGDAEQAYKVEGLHDELITQLAQISSLKVISRFSVVRIRQEKRKSLRDIAQELDVDAVMEGTVQRFGDRIHLSVQVIRVRDDRHLWARSYDRELRNLPSLPSDIARAMAGDLAIPLTVQEQARLASQRTVNPEVYNLCLRGSFYEQKRSKEALNKALENYLQAADLDPTYAPAWNGMGASYRGLSFYGDTEESLAKAKAALLKALELDDTLRTAHTSLARMYMDDWDWKNAEKEFVRAEELDPNWPGPSLYFARLGLFDEAIRAQRYEVERDPLSLEKNISLGWTFFMARRYDQSIAQQKFILELAPNNRLPHYELAWNFARKGMFKEAVAECDAYSQKDPEVGSGDDCGWVYALAGRRTEALAFMERVRKKPKGGPDESGQFARVYDALGDREMALKLLYEKLNKHLPFRGLKLGPIYSDALRADPRFQELVRRAGFPEPSPILLARVHRNPGN
jgi:TolB-like protein/DNA-binding winged helix-turn-helix (wHTH) protein